MSDDIEDSELGHQLESLTGTALAMVMGLLQKDVERAEEDDSAEWSVVRQARVTAEAGPVTIDIGLSIRLTDRTVD